MNCLHSNCCRPMVSNVVTNNYNLWQCTLEQSRLYIHSDVFSARKPMEAPFQHKPGARVTNYERLLYTWSKDELADSKVHQQPQAKHDWYYTWLPWTNKFYMFQSFFVRMLGKLLELTGIEYTIQDGGSLFNSRGTCRACAVEHFLPGRVKKSGYMKMSLSQVQLYLCMIYPLCQHVGFIWTAFII